MFYVKNLGWLTSEHLRVIADELDRLNKTQAAATPSISPDNTEEGYP